MPTTDFSASLTTARRRQLALYAWRLNDNYPQNPTGYISEQAPSSGWRGTGPSGDVPTAVRQGAILAGQPNNNVFPGVAAGCPNGTCAANQSLPVTLQGFVRNSPANVVSQGGSSV
jgi:hypothetical protein